MNSTTIDQNGSADLQGPSTELNHITNVNTPPSISVRYADIPTYLHRSEFYLSLDCDQGEEYISVPANCLWSGGAINSTVQFRQYLHTLHFWGMRHFTLEGLEFVFPTDPRSIGTDDAREFNARHWNTMTDVCGADSTLHGALRSAMDEIIPWGVEDTDPWEIVSPYKLILTRNDGAASMKADLIRILCRSITSEGCLDDLVALHHQHGNGIWNQQTCIRAAQSGNIECVQYLIDNGCECHYLTAGAAAQAGHLHILQYLHNNKLGFDENTNKWPQKVAELAVFGGHVACLAFIHENGHPWDAKACWTAGEKCDMKALQYLHDNSCPWDDGAVFGTIVLNNVDAVKYMVEQGCPIPASACATAARTGHVAILKYLRECGCAWYNNESDAEIHWTAGEAARYGQIDTLRYAVEHGCPLGDNILIHGFRRASMVEDTDMLRCIQYLIEDQLQVMDGRLFPHAFCHGYFQCIRYLIDTGCPHTNVEENPDPPNNYLRIDKSVDPDQFYECLKYAIERGWPLDAALLKAINYINIKLSGKFTRTVEYLQQEGLWS